MSFRPSRDNILSFQPFLLNLAAVRIGVDYQYKSTDFSFVNKKKSTVLDAVVANNKLSSKYLWVLAVVISIQRRWRSKIQARKERAKPPSSGSIHIISPPPKDNTEQYTGQDSEDDDDKYEEGYDDHRETKRPNISVSKYVGNFIRRKSSKKYYSSDEDDPEEPLINNE
eukprot:TRINITY_DN10295_c0_g1_i1.p1 TRINITY_DN10295_c0_g1~~TRINITY_DN10295_c0_g1_i1.p1  ORF type:complete len:169 (-),score=24.03 TRINITY_DN10295_c0_g1_i1:36-542(-)